MDVLKFIPKWVCPTIIEHIIDNVINLSYALLIIFINCVINDLLNFTVGPTHFRVKFENILQIRQTFNLSGLDFDLGRSSWGSFLQTRVHWEPIHTYDFPRLQFYDFGLSASWLMHHFYRAHNKKGPLLGGRMRWKLSMYIGLYGSHKAEDFSSAKKWTGAPSNPFF